MPKDHLFPADDATTSQAGNMSPADKSKLDSIAAGAEVNVQPDWNAVSGDAQILNKPAALPAALPAATHAATEKPSPADDDEIPLTDSAAAWALKKLTWGALKATLASYFGEIYATLASVAAKAPLDSPGLTGIPTAPTAAPGTNTTQLASTAFVMANAGGGGGGGGATHLTTTAAPTTITIVSDTGSDAVIPVPDGTNAGVFLAAEKIKLAGIEPGATAVTVVDAVANGNANAVSSKAVFDSLSALSGAGAPSSGEFIARDSARTWEKFASSADGVKLAATASGGSGGLYTSTDSGVTWTARESVRDWRGVASSADGVKLVAVAFGGRIYTSTDSGVTWIARESVRNWKVIASSSDGSKLVAGVGVGQIYTSTDSGVTWTARESARQWECMTSSADGNKLVAGVNGGQIYTSTDSGVTWTARNSARFWFGVACSSDGVKIVAAVSSGYIYTSTDSGVTWTLRDVDRLWRQCASSADGVNLAAVAFGGRIYTSTDSGVTWTARESVRNWKAIASSSDGSKLVAGDNGGQIYTSTAVTAAGTYKGQQYRKDDGTWYRWNGTAWEEDAGGSTVDSATLAALAASDAAGFKAVLVSLGVIINE